MTNQRCSIPIKSVAVNNQTLEASSPIEYGDFASGVVYIPTGSAIASLQWNVSTKINGNYLEAIDANGFPVQQIVTGGRSYPIPSALAGARFLKIFGDEEGVVSVTVKD